MAVLALGLAGAAIGNAAIAGTVLGMSGGAIGWMAGTMLGSMAFAQDVQGPRLDDLRVSGTEYGATIPWVAGSPRIAGQIVWASPKRETANTQSAKGGPEQTTYTYDCDLLILLTENEIAGVSRIWSNSELVYGVGTTKSGVWGGITVYTGSDDQLPDPTYEAAVGVGNAPAYRGRGYVVITGLQLGGSGAIPNLTFEISFYRPENVEFILNLPLSVDFTNNFDLEPVVESEEINTDESISIDFSELNGVVYTRPTGDEGNFRRQYIVYPASGGVLTNFSEFPSPTSVFTDTYKSGIIEFVLSVFDDSADESISLQSGQYVTIAYCGSHRFFAYPYSVLGGVEWRYSFSVPGDTSNITMFEGLPNPDVNGLVHTNFTMESFVGKRFWLKHDWENEVITSGIDDIVLYSQPLADTEEGMGQFVFGYSHHLTTITGSLDALPSAIGFKNVRIGLVTIEQFSQTIPTVSSVLTELLGRSSYASEDFLLDADFDFAPECRALAIGNVSSTRATLDLLKSAYFLEASKSDKIYIRPRAVDPVATLYFEDMGAAADASATAQAFELTKSNDLEVPAQIALSYANMAADYTTSTEYSDRVLSEQETVSGVQMALGFLPAEAKAIADALIIDAASGVVKATLKVPLRFAYIEPGDVVSAVNEDGRTYRLRVQTKRDTLTIIELECVLDDVGALDSAAVTDTGYTEATVVQVSETEFEALDIPILRDADNLPGYYIATAPATVGEGYEWKGALVARSWDDVSYSELFQTTTASVMGACSTTLGAWTGGNVIDEANTLTVVTTGGELASSTREAMQLDGALNVAAVGSQAGGWEILRFKTATLTAPNTYVLSGFHRGFRGTEHMMGAHTAGEQFVLLNAGVGHVQAQTSQIGLARHIKAVSFGLMLSSVDGEPFTDTGVALKPFAPVNPVALASGADLVLTWQRRTRVSYVYGGATPTVPLGEVSEQYRVRVYDGATLVRTATVTTPTYTYAAADLAADGFASSDPVVFEICQLSEILGAGYPAECEGTAP